MYKSFLTISMIGVFVTLIWVVSSPEFSSVSGLLAALVTTGSLVLGSTKMSNKVKGKGNTVAGTGNEVEGDDNTVLGENQRLSGDENVIHGGRDNTITDSTGSVIGGGRGNRIGGPQQPNT